jgi:hypothetical protein
MQGFKVQIGMDNRNQGSGKIAASADPILTMWLKSTVLRFKMSSRMSDGIDHGSIEPLVDPLAEKKAAETAGDNG